MKKIVLIFIGLFSIGTSFSQILFSEDFNYASGVAGDSIGGSLGSTTALGDTTWKKHSGTATGGRCVKYTPTSLIYAGYAGSGIGGAATFQHSAGSADINARIGFYDSSVGAIYTSFLLKVDSVTGKDTTCDYFFHFCDLAGAGSITNFRGRLFLSPGSDSSLNFKIGVSKGTVAKPAAGVNSPAFTSTQFNLHQTYLVIVKYTFNGTSVDKNDELKVFVLSGAIPATEPTADITFTDANQSDLAKIQSICIRQGSIGRAFATIDGIRVFKTWDAATVAALPVKLNSFNAIGLKGVVNVNWTALCNTNSCKFMVERSTDAVSFETVATLNSTTEKAYSIADKNLPNTATTLYYRLKIINDNGKIEYSNIQKIGIRNIKLSVSPNPVANEIMVNATGNIATIEIFDFSGKKVYSLLNSNTNNVRVPVTNFANGTYIVKTIVDGETTTEKIVVKH
jgi:Secretion system C-terminal sorting domain